MGFSTSSLYVISFFLPYSVTAGSGVIFDQGNTDFFKNFFKTGCDEKEFYGTCKITCLPQESLNLKRYWYFKKLLRVRKPPQSNIYAEQVLLHNQYTPDLNIFQEDLRIRVLPENEGIYICRLVNENQVYQESSTAVEGISLNNIGMPHFNVQGNRAVFSRIMPDNRNIRVYTITGKVVHPEGSHYEVHKVVAEGDPAGNEYDEKTVVLKNNQEYAYCYDDKICGYFKTELQTHNMSSVEKSPPYVKAVSWDDAAPEEVRLTFCRPDPSTYDVPVKFRATVLDTGNINAYYEMIIEESELREISLESCTEYSFQGLDLGKKYAISVGFHIPEAELSMSKPVELTLGPEPNPVAEITVSKLTSTSMSITWDHPYNDRNVTEYSVYDANNRHVTVKYPQNAVSIQKPTNDDQLTKVVVVPHSGTMKLENPPEFYITTWNEEYTEEEYTDKDAEVFEDPPQDIDEDATLKTLQETVEKKELEAKKFVYKFEDMEESSKEVGKALKKLKKAEDDVAAEWKSASGLGASFILYVVITFAIQTAIIVSLLAVIYKNIEKAKGAKGSSRSSKKSKKSRRKSRSTRKVKESKSSTSESASSSRTKSLSISAKSHAKSVTSSTKSSTAAAKK